MLCLAFEGRSVTARGLVEPFGELRPLRRSGELREQVEQEIAIGELTRWGGRRRRNRPALQPCQQLAHARCDRAVAGQGAARRPGTLAQRLKLGEHQIAVSDVGGQGRLRFARRLDRILDAVEYHGAHPAREHVRIGLAEEGAVGEAQIGELRVADEPAQVVEIAGVVPGRDVGEKLTAEGGTALSERHGLGNIALRRRGAGRELPVAPPEARLALRVRKAAHGRAGAGTARIPADDVEPPLDQRVENCPSRPHIVNAGLTGAAEVDEQRTDPLIRSGGEVADNRQCDLGPIGPLPVQRNLHIGALEPLAAASPCDLRAGGSV